MRPASHLIIYTKGDIIFPFGGLIFLCGLSSRGGRGVRGGRDRSGRGWRGGRYRPTGLPRRSLVYGVESRSQPVLAATRSLIDSQFDIIIMLIGLVRDSVLQCFCHTCRAPVLPAGYVLADEPSENPPATPSQPYYDKRPLR